MNTNEEKIYVLCKITGTCCYHVYTFKNEDDYCKWFMNGKKARYSSFRILQGCSYVISNYVHGRKVFKSEK